MTTHALPMPAPTLAGTGKATVAVVRSAVLAVARFLVDVLTVLLDLLATIIWTAVAAGFVYLGALASFANGGPEAMAVTVILGADLVVLGLALWVGLVLLPRYQIGGSRG